MTLENMTAATRYAMMFSLVALALIVTAGFPVAAGAAVHTVTARQGGLTVQSAVAGADHGDTVLIDGGTHRVHELVVDKSIAVIGRNRPIIEGDESGHVIMVTAPGVTVTGLTVRGAPVSFVDDNAAILLENVHDCRVSNNRFENNFFAVYLAKSYDCEVSDNDIVGSGISETQSGNGIHLWYCENIEVINNTVGGHRDGIYFEFVKHSDIAENVSTGNIRYGLHFMFSDTCTYRNNEFLDNGSGVAVMYTHFVTMVGNRFERNWGASSYGLLLKELTDSEVRDNVFDENTVGIYVEGCNRVLAVQNEFRNNGWAIRIMANSIDCRFERNNFIGNSFQVATDSRQNFSTFEANYWSTYSGYDLDRDGYGDVDYHPVSLFSMVVHKNPPTLILLHSLTVELLDLAERIIPILTPETLVDTRPAMEPLP